MHSFLFKHSPPLCVAMAAIGRERAIIYRKDLETGVHRKSGNALTAEDKRRRLDALVARACTLQPRYRQAEEAWIAKFTEALETSEKRVIEATNTHVTATGDRVVQEVVSALKEEKGSGWRDDMTKEEKAVWHRNNVGGSQKWLREYHQEKKKERAAAKLTAAASSDQPAPGTVTCPYKIRQGANKGKVCGRTDCKHEARLKAQEKAEELEESEETRLKTRVQNTKTFESILFSCYPQEIPDSWVEVMQSGYCRLLTEELPSDLEEVVTRLLRTDTTKPSRGLVQQEVAAIEEAQELGAKI